ncbi:MAG: cytochrome b [Gammaproteobacteria bacterium]|nr:MAG: cytochrome b [Gammaproteobacteria bacterium]
MNLKNTQDAYGAIAIFIHWLTAVVVTGLFAVGLWMTDLSYYDPWYRTAPHYHKSVGILLVLLFGFRLLWRFINIKPALPASVTVWEKRLATVVHLAIYGLFLLLAISGYLISTADGRSIAVFNWFEVPALTPVLEQLTAIENLEDIAGDIHFYVACILIGLVALHGLAALKHHFLDKDATLKRMLNPNFKYNK